MFGTVTKYTFPVYNTVINLRKVKSFNFGR